VKTLGRPACRFGALHLIRLQRRIEEQVVGLRGRVAEMVVTVEVRVDDPLGEEAMVRYCAATCRAPCSICWRKSGLPSGDGCRRNGWPDR